MKSQIQKEIAAAREENRTNHILSVFEELNNFCIQKTDMCLDTFLELVDDIHP